MYVLTQGFYDSPVLLGAKRITLEKEGKMPIKGLTEINRPPRQGMLRLGIKKKTKTGAEYPSEVDYFILDPETPDPVEKKRLVDLFHELFGDKPKVIQIRLMSSELNEVFDQNYKRYGKGTSLKCIGDGETATVTDQEFAKGLETLGVDQETKLIKVKCEGRECKFAVANDDSKNKECKATATLRFDIWPLGGMGEWQVTTGSFYSIVTVNSGIRAIIERYGRAHSLPLTLERRPQETTYKGKKATHYTLHINTDASIEELARVSRMTPEQVLIEACAKELPAPEETMDDIEAETAKAVGEASVPTQLDEIKKVNKALDESVVSPKRVPEIVEEAMAAGKMLDQQTLLPEHMGELSSGLGDKVTMPKVTAEATPEEAQAAGKELDKQAEVPADMMPVSEGATTGKAIQEATGATPKEQDEAVQKVVDMMDGEVVNPNVPENFWEFMMFAKKKFKEVGVVDYYNDMLFLFDIKVLSDVKDKPDIQEKLKKRTLEELVRGGWV